MGVTFVTAESAVMRAFSAYVFGHEFELASGMHAHAFGVSAYGNDVFVPFSGLVTLQSLDGQNRRNVLGKFESNVMRAVTAPLISIDIGSSDPRMIERFIGRSASRHVVVADLPDVIDRLSANVSDNSHRVEVAGTSSRRLSLKIYAFPRNRRKF